MAGLVPEFDLNVARTGVAECVDQSFAANKINLVPHRRTQRPPRASHNDPETDLLWKPKFLVDSGKCQLKIISVLASGAETTQCIPALLDDMSHQFEDPAYQSFRR